ncbi:hypothetical protein LOTGIDRAFT_172000 [Lottia gigantea]|uniref:RRM domain-containing protein n=1 Tax=Lottia gigantea TaxID=225164 RepID=V4AEL2_LOTGI|nr:hypothetical protein LOTGIDRAFT_172000 [Lottia gigantea]ESP02444.1 hypothetical protein LOTGIDRAFT_172000 [Lottia gigantea]
MAATSKGTHALPNEEKKEIEDTFNEEIEIKVESSESEINGAYENVENQHSFSSKSQFNRGRKILIKSVPPNSKREDLEETLKEFDVKDISLYTNSKQAIITLENDMDPDIADIVVSKLKDSKVGDNELELSILPYSNILVIAHLPKSMTDDGFRDLVSKYKSVEKCTLVCFEETGKSLQYGLVWFNDNRERNRIKEELDWKDVDGCQLHADIIESCSDYNQLISRCLFIDNLPKTFKEAYKLREIFNCVASPVYCQIMRKDNESTGYGIIEYKQSWEAKETWYKLQEYELDGVIINITFCIPTKPAVTIFNRLMKKIDNRNKVKGSLLPDPVLPVTINNPLVKGLANQNPELMKSFMQVLHHLQLSHSKPTSSSAKPGILGPAPMPMNPAMNSNTQLGLLIFLATHLNNNFNQQFTGPLSAQLNLLQKLGQQKNSNDMKLGDPLTAQANNVIQTLKAQVKDKMTPPSLIPSKDHHLPLQQILQNTRNLNLNLLMNLGQIMTNIQNNKTESLMSKNIPPPGMFSSATFNTNNNNYQQRKPYHFMPKNDPPPPLLSNYQFNTSSSSQQFRQPPALLSDRQNTGTRSLLDIGSMSKPVHQPSRPKPLLDNQPPKPLPLLGDSGYGSQRQGLNSAPSSSFTFGDSRYQQKPSQYGNLQFDSANKPSSLLGNVPVDTNRQPSSLFGNLSGDTNRKPSSFLGNLPVDTSRQPSSLGNLPYDNKPTSLLDNLNHNVQNMPKPLMSDPKPRPLLGQIVPNSTSLLGEPPSDFPTNRNINSGCSIYKQSYPSDSSTSSYGQKGSYSGGHDSGCWPDTPDGLNDETFQDIPNKYYPEERQAKIPSLLSSSHSHNNMKISSRGNYNSSTNQFQNPNAAATYPNKIPSLLSANSTYNTQNGLLDTPRQFTSIHSNNGLLSTPSNNYNTSNSNSLIPNLMNYDSNQSLSLTSNRNNDSNYPQSLMSRTSMSTSSSLDGISHFQNDYGSSVDYSNRNYTKNPPSLMATPVGQKRSFSQLLPAPEQSPEGTYVGQHSQGIGGHYADSYSKRMKLDHRFR